MCAPLVRARTRLLRFVTEGSVTYDDHVGSGGQTHSLFASGARAFFLSWSVAPRKGNILGALRYRVLHLVGGALIATAGLAVAAVPAAHAATSNSVPLNTTCLADLIENDGSTGTPVPPGLPFPLPTTIARVNGPTEVNAGSALTAIAP